MNLCFDPQDRALLRIVADVLNRLGRPKTLSALMAPSMHPQGIKELAAPRGLRIAYAVASLLSALSGEAARERITALAVLRDELLLSADIRMPRNTARVLMQIMKDLIRHQGDTATQLRLAHAFRTVSTGHPRAVRRALAHYHLLEMPEEWNQIAFDDHVHDANTKGRKTPTHLVMDAWIKGIRHLTVVYYHWIAPHVAQELLEAAAILELRVRIGIEVQARFRGRYVRFTWEPFQEPTPGDFRHFLQAPAVRQVMGAGEAVARYYQQYVFGALEAFNAIHRHTLAQRYGTGIPAAKQEDFLQFVGTGQPSLLHLARYLELHLHRAVPSINPSDIDADADGLIQHYLQPCRNPHLHDPFRPQDGPEVPEALRQSPHELLSHLASIHPSSRFVLNPRGLSLADILEIVALCHGLVTDIEILNLKDLTYGRKLPTAPCTEAVEAVSPKQVGRRIAEFQHALGQEHIIALKRVVRSIVWDYHQEREEIARSLSEHAADPAEVQNQLEAMDARCAVLLGILESVETLHRAYVGRPMGLRVGSSSTGQSKHHYGMGLAVVDTLPKRVQKAIGHGPSHHRLLLPLRASMIRHTREPVDRDAWSWAVHFLNARPRRSVSWEIQSVAWNVTRGNIVTLGGIRGERPGIPHAYGPWWACLNTHMKNGAKIAVGFLPAFYTFWLTKDWWVLAWGGAFIWFAITGVRNILQTVLGGGGLRRSSLLPWQSLIRWNRIADSLFYTGFSVPLLDYVVKTLLLDHLFGITTATQPIALYAVMAIANGVYLFSHNMWRGLPRAAAVGNIFRSVLSIPLAVLFNAVLGLFLRALGVADVEAALQAGAAIISKLASDTVAGGIEGLADRSTNITMRLRDYSSKLEALFNTFARLDALFPEEDVLEMLQTPKAFLDTLDLEAQELEQRVIVNALDLMYFWYYQPRARSALRHLVLRMSQEEWLIFFRSQLVLRRYREISRMFVDGLVGKDFSKALAFYLDNYESYLRDMERLGRWRRAHALLQQEA